MESPNIFNQLVPIVGYPSRVRSLAVAYLRLKSLMLCRLLVDH